MLQDIRSAVIQRLVREWRSVQQADRPWGMWIREYASLPPDAQGLRETAVPLRVWFVDDAGLREESIWKWARFFATRPVDHSDAGKRLFAIGRVAFARYAECGDLYVEAVWGPTHGWGSRWSFDEDSERVPKGSLWRS